MISENNLKGSSFVKNKLDILLFKEIYEESSILKDINKQGQVLFDDFGIFMFDLFLLLYKVVLIKKNISSSQINNHFISYIEEMTQLKKVRTRTIGSKYETYIVYKYFMDILFTKLRGSLKVKELVSLSKELEKYESDANYLKNQLDRREFDTLPTDNFDSLSQRDLDNLIKINKQLAEIKEGELTLNELIKKIIQYGDTKDSDFNENGDFKKLDEGIKAAKESQSKEYENEDIEPDSSDFLEKISYELEKAKAEQVDNSFVQESTLDGDLDAPETTIKASFDSAFKEMIFDLEKKSNTEKSQQLIKESSFKNKGQHWLQHNEVDGEVDDYRIIDGKSKFGEESLYETIGSNNGSAFGTGFINNKPSSLPETPSNKPNTTFNDMAARLKEKENSILVLKKKIHNKLESLNLESIIESTIKKVDKFNLQAQSLNLNINNLNTYSFDEILNFFKGLEDPKMIKFLNKVGKKKSLAARAQYNKQKSKEILSDKIILSDDIDNLVDDELLPLGLDVEAFENDFIDRFLHNGILTLEQISKTAKHKGPIILCYDGSGSMEGQKIAETKAHIVAFIEVARIQKRKLIAIQFASSNEPLYIQEINPKNVTIETITDLVDTFIRGGTDFEKPLRKAIEYIQTDKYKQADVLFITDGICQIEESFKSTINRIKKEKKFKLYTIIIHGNTYEDYRDIGQISDEVLEIKQRDLSDWNEKISERIFSI